MRFLVSFSILCIFLISFSSALVALDNTYEASDGASVKFPGYLSNDEDPDGDDIWGTLVKGVAHGTLNFGEAGNFTYLSALNFHGVDYFSYVATDGYSNSSIAEVVLGVNDSTPLAVKDKYYIPNYSEKLIVNNISAPSILANDFDSDKDSIYAYFVKDVHSGTLVKNLQGFLVNGTFNYTASKSDGVDYFSYYVSDKYANSSSVDCVFVIGTNTAPVAVADEYYVANSSVKLVVNASKGNGILANDTNLENDDLIISIVQDANGSLVILDDGSFNYTAASGFVGVDNFSYKLSDRDLESAVVNVSIYVGVNKTVKEQGQPAPAVAVSGGGGGGTCTTQWSCGEWGECTSGGFQLRTCSYPAGSCTPTNAQPTQSQSCNYVINLGNQSNQTLPQTNVTNTTQGFFSGITGAVIGTTAGKWSLSVLIFLILVGLAWWIVAFRKRRALVKPIKKK